MDRAAWRRAGSDQVTAVCMTRLGAISASNNDLPEENDEYQRNPATRANGALRHRSLSRLAQGRGHSRYGRFWRRSVRCRYRAMAALWRRGRGGASQRPRRLRQYVRARYRARQVELAAAASL